MQSQQLKSKIAEFIKGKPSYHAGLALFLQICTNPNLIRTLARGESDRNWETMLYEMQKIHKQLPDDLSEESKSFEPIEIAIEQPVPAKAEQGLKKAFSDEQRELYRSRGHFHGMLHSAQTNDERLKIMLELHNIQRKIDTSHGHVAKLEAGIVETAILKTQVSAEDILRIRNLKMYIARNEKKLKQLPPNEKTKRNILQNKIEEFQKELNEKSWN